MRNTVVKVDPEAFRESLRRQTKAAHKRKALMPDGFPFGVAAIDGKFNAIVAWYENLGDSLWGAQQMVASCKFTQSVFSEDMDSDGDMDILVASDWHCYIAWYENTDGQGTFGEQHVITTYYVRGLGLSVYASDMDGDGDADVLCS